MYLSLSVANPCKTNFSAKIYLPFQSALTERLWFWQREWLLGRSFLRDLKTQNETKRRIVQFGADCAGLTQVGIEFVRPASRSWLVTSLLDGCKSVSA